MASIPRTATADCEPAYSSYWSRSRQRRAAPLRYQHVQFWGGLRGAISLALALSLPASFADRNLVLVITLGVVLFTLLVQGTTMNALLKRLGLIQREEAQLEYERRHGRLMAARAAHARVAALHREGMIAAATREARTGSARPRQDPSRRGAGFFVGQDRGEGEQSLPAEELAALRAELAALREELQASGHRDRS